MEKQFCFYRKFFPITIMGLQVLIDESLQGKPKVEDVASKLDQER